MIASVKKPDNVQLQDPETGLYTRKGLETVGARLLASEQTQDFAIVRLDIFRYRLIREYVGYLETARLLRFIGKRLIYLTGPDGICGHFGGDSFAFVMPFDTINEVYQVVEELIYDIRSFKIPCRILPAAGIYIVEDHTENPEYMIECAKIALDTIKGNFSRSYAVFDTGIRKSILKSRRIETRTAEALRCGEFKAYYQPQIDMRSGEILGVEALVRWEKPEEGTIYPEEFLSVFEQDGFILDMDFAVWEDAFAQKAKWIEKGIDIPYLAINVSSVHRMDDLFIRRLHNLVQKYRLDPTKIALDLNEFHYGHNLEERYDTLCKLKAMGYIISFDDYGGESISVSVLTKFQLDMVSLDRAMVVGIGTGEKHDLVIRSAIRLFHELGILLIAEGVETEEQKKYLLDNGCYLGQGYLFYRPMPAEDLEQLLTGSHKNI